MMENDSETHNEELTNAMDRAKNAPTSENFHHLIKVIIILDQAGYAMYSHL